MPSCQPVLLIIDYNLSRIDEVARMRKHAQSRWGAQTWLIRDNPQPIDLTVCDAVFDIDPLSEAFVEQALRVLGQQQNRISAGLVFSDNAVVSGSALLERLGLAVDGSELALAAFDKFIYRLQETMHRTVLEADGVLVPAFEAINDHADLTGFALQHPGGFVVKPTREGNNRGVVVVREEEDIAVAWTAARPYLQKGVMAEQLITYRREFSYDGLGELSFITEKISAQGRYPVEVAQVLPARLTRQERQTLMKTGVHINRLTGQCKGPFHNEIKLSDDGSRAAVVEPNRRPAGMKIWSLAEHVYGHDFFASWVDSVFGAGLPASLPEPLRSAATVMLGVPHDIEFAPRDIANEAQPFTHALQATAARFHLSGQELVAHDFAWLGTGSRSLHRVARDNSDFAAQVCIVLETDSVDIRDVVTTLREQWLLALAPILQRHMAQCLAS